MDLLATSDEDIEEPMPIRPRNFRLRQCFEEIEFRERFRLTRTQAEDLLQLIGQQLKSLTNRSFALRPIQTTCTCTPASRTPQNSHLNI